MRRLAPAADGSVKACWFPGLFLLNDFTVPGVAMEQGRRQEPCYTPYHPHAGLSNTFARLPAVLLRLAIRIVNSKFRFLDSLIATP